MFNCGVYPAFSNVSYKTSYACNMSASLLVLVGYTKTSFVSYAYGINIYYIPLLLVTGKRPVKSMYILLVLGFANPVAANTQ